MRIGGSVGGTPVGGPGGGTAGGPGAAWPGVGGRAAPPGDGAAACDAAGAAGAATTLSCAKSVLLTIWRLCAASVLLGLASEICAEENARPSQPTSIRTTSNLCISPRRFHPRISSRTNSILLSELHEHAKPPVRTKCYNLLVCALQDWQVLCSSSCCKMPDKFDGELMTRPWQLKRDKS